MERLLVLTIVSEKTVIRVLLRQTVLFMPFLQIKSIVMNCPDGLRMQSWLLPIGLRNCMDDIIKEHFDRVFSHRQHLHRSHPPPDRYTSSQPPSQSPLSPPPPPFLLLILQLLLLILVLLLLLFLLLLFP